MVTAAAGSWVVALDNLSGIPPWLSDSLCRAVTGDGSVKRALYTDAGLSIVSFRRCVIVNGIDVGAVRPDLGERLAVVDLKRIDGACGARNLKSSTIGATLVGQSGPAYSIWLRQFTTD